MDQKSNYTKEDLLNCAHGTMFGIGNARLPLPPMLMFDRITKLQVIVVNMVRVKLRLS